MKNPIALLIILLWLLLGFWFYKDHSSCCGGAGTQEVSQAVPAPSVVEKETGPLLFDYSKESAITNDAWPERHKSVLASVANNQLLEITGLYRSDEVNNTKFENLGLARANEVRKLFPELKDEQVRLQSRLRDGESNKTNPFSSCELNARMNTVNVKEIDDKALIYFPFNSTNKINSTEVEKYLNDVADRVIKSGEQVILTGHTDDVGSDDSNIALGQRRADVIKNYLIERKVPRNKVNSTSKGESAPISSNDTEDGRAKNRRTELQIIK